MSTYQQMQQDMQLLGMASLIQQDFGSLINKCQREEVESYPWSFLFKEVTVNATPVVTGGLATVATGSSAIAFQAGFSPQALGVLPGWFIWLGPSLTIPFIIKAVVSSIGGGGGVILTVPYQLPSLVAMGVSMQPLYYSIAPLHSVARVRQIDSLIETSRGQLDSLDPSRIATGGAPAIRWAFAPFDFPFPSSTSATSQNNAQIELWPRPSCALPYLVDGKCGPIDMVNPTDLPMIPSQVLEAKAMMYACRAVFASSGNPKWLSLSEAYRTDYSLELEKAKHEDSKRVTPKGITSWGGRRLFDASIDVTHDLSGPPGD